MSADCIFCKISRHEVPATVVYENDQVIAFCDLHPKAKHHVLVVPKQHVASLAEATLDDQLLLGALLAVSAAVAEKLGIRESGFKCIINTGADGGQEVPHLHIHLLGGEPIRWGI